MEPMALVLFGLFLLAFVRIVTFFVQAPIWGSHHINPPILVGTALAFTVLVYPSLTVPAAFPTTLVGYMRLVFIQAGIGLVIGYVSFLVMASAQFAGEILDVQMGLSVAASFDPASHGAVNLIRRFKFYFAMILFLILDGHHQLISAVFASFRVIPLTGWNFNGALVHNLIGITGEIFVLGIQMAAPVLAALFITQVALGLLARVAPQMNVFMLSFPLNIMIGLTLLAASLYMIARLLDIQFGENYNQIMESIKMLSGGR